MATYTTNGGILDSVPTACTGGAVAGVSDTIGEIIGGKAGQICIILAVVMLLLTLFVV